MREPPPPIYKSLLRIVSVGLGLLVCIFLIWTALVFGLSRLYSAFALKAGRLDAAEGAVSLTPMDPRAHLIRAALLKENDKLDEALKEYEQAVALRPRDYTLWLELGLARDQAEDQVGALAAFREAVRLAPDYAEPRWQLGNVELRAGRFNEAFAELRRATASKPALLAQLIDLAWAVHRGDIAAVEDAVRPQTPAAQFALARFAVKHGKPLDAVRLFRAAGQVSEEERRALLAELLNAKEYRTAYEIWSMEKERLNSGADLIDGGFEEEINLSEQGFGWRVERNVSSVQVLVDSAQPHGGGRSLKLDWKGDSNPATPILSQLILVEPNAHYRLSFAARTEQLVTGGPPFVKVSDAASSQELAGSAVLNERVSPWQVYTLEFTTGKDAQAIMIALLRQNCSRGPCPIFGSLWLDDFALQKK